MILGVPPVQETSMWRFVDICRTLPVTTFAKVYDYQVKVGMLKAENGDADHGIGKHV